MSAMNLPRTNRHPVNHKVCTACRGQCVETGPVRLTRTENTTLTRIRPCSRCEGHGVEMRPSDRALDVSVH